MRYFKLFPRLRHDSFRHPTRVKLIYGSFLTRNEFVRHSQYRPRADSIQRVRFPLVHVLWLCSAVISVTAFRNTFCSISAQPCILFPQRLQRRHALRMLANAKHEVLRVQSTGRIRTASARDIIPAITSASSAERVAGRVGIQPVLYTLPENV